jgi:hypothetical protein
MSAVADRRDVVTTSRTQRPARNAARTPISTIIDPLALGFRMWRYPMPSEREA